VWRRWFVLATEHHSRTPPRRRLAPCPWRFGVGSDTQDDWDPELYPHQSIVRSKQVIRRAGSIHRWARSTAQQQRPTTTYAADRSWRHDRTHGPSGRSFPRPDCARTVQWGKPSCHSSDPDGVRISPSSILRPVARAGGARPAGCMRRLKGTPVTDCVVRVNVKHS
jgi:hypothetical protein